MSVRPRTRARDRGQAAIEYLGFLPILLIVGLAGLQLGVAAYAAQQAGTAARAAARAAGDDEDATDGETAGYAAADWATAVHVDRNGGEAVATVKVHVPSVVPFWNFDDVTKTATMPLPETPDEEDLP
ncbi:TadE-like protein [Streptomyces sp. PanSC19]|uniref:TadE/TadG family type IV pilus assembly protein n=1 Tax=Streptomyces litmocidini TaxID=67318 RepID=A0ABW7U1P7_9ACTN|nr:TadE/TadG family type IV pilus assembly protein [Streptomyces sp. PanSC19]ROQ34098.1 TadE-like protein [Streptomyces sp. PanSC19]